MDFVQETTGWFGALSGAIFGLIFGSFVGMASWRWPRDENWMDASRCTTCSKNLSVRDLIPVFSWLFAKGRSRCCQTPICARYPLIELAVAIPCTLAGWKFGMGPDFVALACLIATLVFLTVVDLDTYLIPDGSHLLILLSGALWIYLHPPAVWWYPALTLAQTAGVGVLLAGGYSWLRKRDMMGWGDVKLMAASALWLPPELAPIYLFLSGILGVLFGLWWTQGKQNPEFPFGPALAVTLILLTGWQALKL
jgi:prepilin signal peptidase PulO-like enzyme (type II secretory pathway)